MATKKELRFVITGESVDAQRAFSELSKEALKSGAITEAQLKRIGDAFESADRKSKGAGASLATSARSSAAGKLDTLAGGGLGGDLLGSLGGSEEALAGISTGVVAAAAGVAALGVSLVKLGQISVQSFQSVGTEITKFRATLGVSAEEATRFWYALSASGTKPEQAIDALNQFSINIKQNADDLRAYGVTVEKTAAGSTDLVATLYNVMDAYTAMGGGAEGAALLQKTLGEEGARQLLPFLLQGSDAARKMGDSLKNTITDEDLAKLQSFNASWGATKAQLRLAGASIGAELVPYLQIMAEVLGAIVDKAGDMGGAVEAGVEGSIDAVTGFLGLVPGLSVVAPVAGEAMTRAFDKAVGSIEAAAQKTADARAEMERLISDIEAREIELKFRVDLAGGFQKISDATSALTEASQGVAQAQADASTSIAAANRSAEQSVASAAKSMESAHRAQSDAAAGLAKAEADASRSMSDAAEGAAKSIASAQQRVGDAIKRRADADKDMARTERDVARDLAKQAEDSAERIVDAQKRVDDAREDARRAARDGARDLADAQAAYQDALLGSLDESNPFKAQRDREKALLELQRTQTDVAESNQDAAKNVAEAEQELRDVHVEAAERRAEAEEKATEQIEAARERQSEAGQAVIDAEQGLADAVRDGERSMADAARGAAESVSAARQRVVDADAAAYAAASAYGQAIEDADAAKAKAAEDAATRIEAARKRESDAAKQLLLDELEVARLRRQAADPNFVDYMALSESNFLAESDTVYPRRARGGPVSAGTTYLVGEEGPELLHMGSSGVVSPNSALGGQTLVINMNAPFYGDERRLAEEIAKSVRRGNGG